MNTSLTQSPLTLDSIEAYKRYNISPSNLRFMIQNIFYFPQGYKDALTSYHLSIVDTFIFINSIEEGLLCEDGILHQIIYHNTDPTKLLRRMQYTKVKMSFRQADPIFNIPPTVLVKEVHTNPTKETP